MATKFEIPAKLVFETSLNGDEAVEAMYEFLDQAMDLWLSRSFVSDKNVRERGLVMDSDLYTFTTL